MQRICRFWIGLMLLNVAVICPSAPAGEPATLDKGKAMPEDGTFAEDRLPTSVGELKITFVGHGTLMFTLGATVIHVDPVSQEADYSKMPRADLILVTHGHPDHLDAKAIKSIRGDKAPVVIPAKWASAVPEAVVMTNGESRTVAGIAIEAVPAYNIVHKRPTGEPFHPRGEGNGYVLTFGDLRVYVAGDTENVPEMKDLKDIGVAFLPMNLPYTMTPEMVASAARSFHPRILYPYHYGKTDTNLILKQLEGEKGLEVRIRRLP